MDDQSYGVRGPRTTRFPVPALADPVRSENTVDEHTPKQVKCAETESTRARETVMSAASPNGPLSPPAAALERGLHLLSRWVEDGAAALAAEQLPAWERELLLADWDPGARLPLAVLVRELADPAGADRERVAWACLCVTEWALETGVVSTGLAFAEAAARAWPEQGRYAWAAGRLLRSYGRHEAGAAWLRRAARVTEQAGDREGRARALAALARG